MSAYQVEVLSDRNDRKVIECRSEREATDTYARCIADFREYEIKLRRGDVVIASIAALPRRPERSA